VHSTPSISTGEPAHAPPLRTDFPTVWVPGNLRVDGLLTAVGSRIAEGVLLLGHFVFEQLAADARYRDDGKVRLKAEYLRAVIGRHHLDRVRHTAERIGYVARDPSYRAGHKSQTYWIREPYADARLVQRQITDGALRRGLRKWRESRHEQNWRRIRRNETPVAREVVEHLWRHVQRIRLEEHVDLDEDFHPAHQIAVDQIRRGQLRISVDDFGRVHTNLTNLRRDLRGSLRVEGAELVNVDIGESQPLFIGLTTAMFHRGEEVKGKGRKGTTKRESDHGGHYHMMDNTMMDKATPLNWRLKRDRLPRDLVRFLALCESRRLYGTVAEAVGTSRDEAKRKVLAAFFDTPSHRNKVHAVLDTLFPSVMAAIVALKRGDYRRLAHFAQRVESGFIFGRVVPRLMAEQPDQFISTIHDSVLTIAGNGDFVRRVMLEESAQVGLSPTIRLEAC